jgi:hypothetical protein
VQSEPARDGPSGCPSGRHQRRASATVVSMLRSSRSDPEPLSVRAECALTDASSGSARHVLRLTPRSRRGKSPRQQYARCDSAGVQVCVSFVGCARAAWASRGACWMRVRDTLCNSLCQGSSPPKIVRRRSKEEEAERKNITIKTRPNQASCPGATSPSPNLSPSHREFDDNRTAARTSLPPKHPPHLLLVAPASHGSPNL